MSPAPLEPEPRTGAAFVYDAATGSTLLFGGSSMFGASGSVLGDTWSWDGSAWHQAHPADAPSARSGAAMTFDAACNDAVLFGGYVPDTSVMPPSPAWSDETWTWNGSDWTLQHPAHTPPARGIATFAYDATLQQAVLFAGTGIPHSCCTGLSDTWAWNGSDWSQIQPATSPPPTVDAALAFDSVHGQLVLFGNYSASGADTWTFDGTNWTDHPAVASGPPQLDSPSLAFDAATGSTVMFGGHHNAPTDATWLWNGSAWTAANPSVNPTSRSAAAATYDPKLGLVLIFGGMVEQNGDPMQEAAANDLWAWNGIDWQRLA